MKKKIKIDFVDFFRGFDKENNQFTNILRERYDVEISDSPKYIFYSTFGKTYLDYDCVKIYFTGECIVPDFNLCDYAMAFDHINFGDRYLRVPLYEVLHYKPKYQTLIDGTVPVTEKTDFCGFVVSNDQGMKERQQMFNLLSAYKKVDSGGRYMNNIGGPVKDKLAFDQSHKFSLTFENCSHVGYTTEKIVEAFAAGAIPIYYGNPEIGKEFNTKAFVNIHEFASLEDAVRRIMEIDQNDELYKQIKAEPIISGARKDDNRLRSFLYAIFDQPLESARRRPYNTRIEERESEFKLVRKYENLLGKRIKRVKALFRRIKNNAI